MKTSTPTSKHLSFQWNKKILLGFIIANLFGLFACKEVKKSNKISKRDRIDLAYQQEIEMTMDPATGTVPRERLISALAYTKKLQDKKKRTAIGGVSWVNLGPINQGGRTRAMMVDANDVSGNTVFVGSVGGGLWKTTNITAAAPNWTPIDDFMNNIAITGIAQDMTATNVMYACTGEAFGNSDAIRGLGVFKSTNGGTTWTSLASTLNNNFLQCYKIMVTSNGTVMVGTTLGLFRSTDGGTTFTKVLGNGMVAGAVNDRCYDIEQASNGDIYASLRGSIHKSTNNGASFAAAMTIPIAAQRIELAVALSNANTAYALIEQGSAVNGIIKTTNGGTSWTSMTEPDDADPGISNTDFSRGQAWYDLAIMVDPNNANTVWVGGIDVFKSTDGAATWTQQGHWYGGFGFQYVHADQHYYTYAPGSSTVAYFCNDGGIYRTDNANAANPTITDKGTNYVTLQLYGCDIHPTSNYYLGGTQDNGTHRFNSNNPLQNALEVTGGDGAYCNIDQNQTQYQFTQYVYNNYFRSTNGGASFTDEFFANTGRFINPSDYDHVNNRLYAGAGSTQYFRWNDPQTGTSTATISTSMVGNVTAVTVSPNMNNRVYFGTSSGRAYSLANAHATPTVTDISFAASGTVSCIHVDKTDENRMLGTLSNYGVTSVFLSTNGGASWVAVEGNLPDMPVRWAVFNPNNTNQALLATELGVWSTDLLNGNATDWAPTNTGLANVRVDMLKFSSDTPHVNQRLIASTHGRGMYFSNSFIYLPLPLDEIHLSANRAINNVNVAWDTKNEREIVNYEVERSLDGNTFETIGTKSAYNTLSANYQLQDVLYGVYQSSEKLYYRIKINNRDGKFNYTEVVKVLNTNNTAPALEVYPNPASDYFQILSTDEVQEITVANFLGRIVLSTKNTSGKIYIPESITTGEYFVKVQIKGQTKVLKLMVRR